MLVAAREHDGLAGPGGLHEQRLARLAGEALAHPLDRLDLLHAIGDREVWRHGRERLLSGSLMDQVLQGVQ